MWTYQISTGLLIAPDQQIEGHGYSGQPQFKNDPTAVAIHNAGPIPPNVYRVGAAFNHPEKGKLVLPLTPKDKTAMFDRDGFLVHGDNIHAPGTASEGCIILGRAARLALSLSEDHELRVTA
jgi:hypothetical protein